MGEKRNEKGIQEILTQLRSEVIRMPGRMYYLCIVS
jgi:hypothetical protein